MISAWSLSKEGGPAAGTGSQPSIHGPNDLCTSEEINLVGIKFPLTREFYEELGSRSYGADSVLQSHGYPVLDYKTEFVDSCSYFRDQDHLNHRGSKMFVDQLRRDLYSGGPLQH
jgi:hypothetical protein